MPDQTKPWETNPQVRRQALIDKYGEDFVGNAIRRIVRPKSINDFFNEFHAYVFTIAESGGAHMTFPSVEIALAAIFSRIQGPQYLLTRQLWLTSLGYFGEGEYIEKYVSKYGADYLTQIPNLLAISRW